MAEPPVVVVGQVARDLVLVVDEVDRLSPACRVILDGVPENALSRDRILAGGSVLRLDAREAELLAGSRSATRRRRASRRPTP